MAYVKNSADPKQVRNAKKRERIDREQEINDMASILETEAGRRTLWRYLMAAGIFKCSFTGDATTTVFWEGNRNIGLKILDDIMLANPAAYHQMYAAQAQRLREEEFEKDENENESKKEEDRGDL